VVRASRKRLGKREKVKSDETRKLLKALTLSFALGGIRSVALDSSIMHQAEAMAIAKAQATIRSLSSTLEHWLEQGLDAVLKGIVKQFMQDG
jgi:hypothetical protein